MSTATTAPPVPCLASSPPEPFRSSGPGARVGRNVALAAMNLDVPIHDGRRIEVPALAWCPTCRRRDAG